MFNQVRDEIPLHHASRHWIRHKSQPLASNDWMRWNLFLDGLRHYDVRFDPKPAKRGIDALTRATLVVPQASDCIVCGRPFIRDLGNQGRGSDGRACSLQCGAVRRRKPGEKVMAKSDADNPEIVAVQSIIEILSEVPRELRPAVIAFVEAWLERQVHPTVGLRQLRNGAAGSA